MGAEGKVAGEASLSPQRKRDLLWQRSPRIVRFFLLAIEKARADDLTRQSAALAFITMISLIPLLAVISYFGARTFLSTDGTDGSAMAQQEIISIISQILPYSETAILDQLRTFLDHASTINSFGFAMFILTSLSAFTTIEGTVNRIWNVTGRRTFRTRLLSFTLVLFWGPILIGAAYSSLFYLRQRLPVEQLDYVLLIELMPSFFTAIGLTMLYWLVPATRVRFRSAVIGGLVAALLLEFLRRSFGLYISRVPNFSLIYGSFGLALLFMISVQIAWWIVLLGNEIAYALQHFKTLTERRLPAAPFEGSWLGLAALVSIAERFRRGSPITPSDLLAETLHIRAEALEHVIQPLVDHGYLRIVSGEDDGYLLNRDPHDLSAARVFTLYDDLNGEILAPLTAQLGSSLLDLHSTSTSRRYELLADLTIADLADAKPIEIA